MHALSCPDSINLEAMGGALTADSSCKIAMLFESGSGGCRGGAGLGAKASGSERSNESASRGSIERTARLAFSMEGVHSQEKARKRLNGGLRNDSYMIIIITWHLTTASNTGSCAHSTRKERKKGPLW